MGIIKGVLKSGLFGLLGMSMAKKKKKPAAANANFPSLVPSTTDPIAPVSNEKTDFSSAFTERSRSIEAEERGRKEKMRSRP